MRHRQKHNARPTHHVRKRVPREATDATPWVIYKSVGPHKPAAGGQRARTCFQELLDNVRSSQVLVHHVAKLSAREGDLFGPQLQTEIELAGHTWLNCEQGFVSIIAENPAWQKLVIRLWVKLVPTACWNYSADRDEALAMEGRLDFAQTLPSLGRRLRGFEKFLARAYKGRMWPTLTPSSIIFTDWLEANFRLRQFLDRVENPEATSTPRRGRGRPKGSVKEKTRLRVTILACAEIERLTAKKVHDELHLAPGKCASDALDSAWQFAAEHDEEIASRKLQIGRRQATSTRKEATKKLKSLLSGA
jgi:hypothetical protein